MAIFTFTQPGNYGSTYFTLETVRNNQGFYDSSSLKNAEGFYSNFNGVVGDHLVTSSYIFAEVIPPGTSSFEFNPLVSGMPTGSFYFRGTGNMTVTLDTYSGSYTLTPAQLYGQGILNTFALTPIPDFQSRVAASGGYYQDIESQNTILNNIGTDLLRSASLVITPNAYKEDALYSVVPTNGNGDFTVTRATTATLTDANGNVVLEPYNLVQFSEQFDNAYWIKTATVTSNTTISPNGNQDADTFTDNSTSYQEVRTPSITIIANSTYTVSVFIKKTTGALTYYPGIGILVSSVSTKADFGILNTTTGQIVRDASSNINSATYSTQSVGDYWRVIVTFTDNQSNLNCGVYLYPAISSNGTSISPTAQGSNVFWGAQLVEGTSALPYQPTLDRLDRVRFDYSIGGEPNILLEPQRTNLVVSSSQFDGANWSKTAVSITANSTTSPSGIVDADTLTADGTLTIHRAGQVIGVINATTYSHSVYAKKDTGNFLQLLTADAAFGGNVWANFDINNGVIGTVGSAATASIENAGNGWYRCILRGTAVSTTNNFFSCAVVSSATAPKGEGTSITSSIFLWGAQLEAGAYATSYIPTTTATVTRNTDVITQTNVYTNNLITAAGGTWFVDFRNNLSYIRDASTNGLSLTDATVLSFGFRIKTYAPNNRIAISKVISGTETPIYTTLTDTAKIVIKWNGSTADLFVNGTKQVSATAFTDTAMQTILSNLSVPMYINSMLLYPTPLPDSKCIELTTL